MALDFAHMESGAFLRNEMKDHDITIEPSAVLWLRYLPRGYCLKCRELIQFEFYIGCGRHLFEREVNERIKARDDNN